MKQFTVNKISYFYVVDFIVIFSLLNRTKNSLTYFNCIRMYMYIYEYTYIYCIYIHTYIHTYNKSEKVTATGVKTSKLFHSVYDYILLFSKK